MTKQPAPVSQTQPLVTAPAQPVVSQPSQPVTTQLCPTCSTSQNESIEQPSQPSQVSQPAVATPQQPAAVTEPVQQPVVADVTALPAVAPVASEGGLKGWLEQQDVGGVASNVILRDRNGEVAAVIIVPPGSNINPADFFWRRVVVQGPVAQQSAVVDGFEKTVSVVTATDLYLAK